MLKNQNRKSKVAVLAALLEVDQLHDGPLTRSRIKAQSNRLSIDEIASSCPTKGKRYNRITLVTNKDLDDPLETQLTTPVKKGRKKIIEKIHSIKLMKCQII